MMAPAPAVPTSLHAAAPHGLSRTNSPPQMPLQVTDWDTPSPSQAIPSWLGLMATTMLVPSPAAPMSSHALATHGLSKPNSLPMMPLQVTYSDGQ